jgi:TetR/AcrR family transcriptional repressor of mexCD-oprJ operon
MTPAAARPVEYLRADAARNVVRIVEVAARLFGDDPQAGMADVGAAAGVSRATVYRHFPTKEALVGAIRRQAIEHGEQALLRSRLDEGSATDALRRLVEAWLDVAERYAFPQPAARAELTASPEARERQRRVFGEPVAALVARGQAAGEFSCEVSPEWAARVFGVVLLAGARSLRDGTLPRAGAAEHVFRTLLGGLRA